MPQKQVAKEELRDGLHYFELRNAGKIMEKNGLSNDMAAAQDVYFDKQTVAIDAMSNER